MQDSGSCVASERSDLVLQTPPAAGRSISVLSLAILLSFQVAQSQFLPIHTEQRYSLQRKARPPARTSVSSPGAIYSTDKCSGSPGGAVSASGSYYTDTRINSRTCDCLQQTVSQIFVSPTSRATMQ